MIDKLLRALQALGSEPDAMDVADMIWYWQLLHEQESVDDHASLLQSDAEQKPSHQDHGFFHQSQATHQSASDTQHASNSTSDQGSDEAQLYPKNGLNISDDYQPQTIHVTKLPTLKHSLAYARALRPLRRKMYLPQASILDELATVQATAEAGYIRVPVFQHLSTRWLSIDLVIDQTPSMRIWRQLIIDFRNLLQHQGAFQQVRTWSLDTDEDTPQLYPGLGLGRSMSAEGLPIDRGTPRQPNELVDRSGCRVILIFSDCVAQAWNIGAVQKWCRDWGKTNRVALINMLPSYLWSRTAIRQHHRAPVRATSTSGANQHLSIDIRQTTLDQEDITASVALPTFFFDTTMIARWSHLVIGNSEASVDALMLEPSTIFKQSAEDIQQQLIDSEMTPEERVHRFFSTATDFTKLLAAKLAFIPLTLPIIRLVQVYVLPKTNRNHLAELFVSGLIRIEHDHDDPEHVLYDFHSGVREILQTSLSRDDAQTVVNFLEKDSDVIKILSESLGQHLMKTTGQTFSAAMIRHDIVQALEETHIPQAPFARIKLKWMGIEVKEEHSDGSQESHVHQTDYKAIQQACRQYYQENWTVLVYTKTDDGYDLTAITPSTIHRYVLSWEEYFDQFILRVGEPGLRSHIFTDIRYRMFQEQPHLRKSNVPLQPWKQFCDLAEALLPYDIRSRISTNPDHRMFIVPSNNLYMVPWASLRINEHWLCEYAVIHIIPDMKILLDAPKTKRGAGYFYGCETFDNPDYLPLFDPVDELKLIKEIWGLAINAFMDAQYIDVQNSANKWQSAAFIQFSTQAWMGESDQLIGHIALKDQNLWLDEIELLQAHQACVLLSACKGARVIYQSKKKYESLALSWLKAGAGSVIASLWDLQEGGFLEVLRYLYKYLQQGYDTAMALAYAQRQCYQDAPYDGENWATFIHTGGVHYISVEPNTDSVDQQSKDEELLNLFTQKQQNLLLLIEKSRRFASSKYIPLYLLQEIENVEAELKVIYEECLKRKISSSLFQEFIKLTLDTALIKEPYISAQPPFLSMLILGNDEQEQQLGLQLRRYGAQVEYGSELSLDIDRWNEPNKHIRFVVVVLTPETLSQRLQELAYLTTCYEHNTWLLPPILDDLHHSDMIQALDMLYLPTLLQRSFSWIEVTERTDVIFEFIKMMLLQALTKFSKDTYVDMQMATFLPPPKELATLFSFDWRGIDFENNIEVAAILEHIKPLLIEKGLSKIVVKPTALKLSAGLMVGFVFRLTTGFNVYVQRGSSDHVPGSWWSMTIPGDFGKPGFTSEISVVDENADNATLEISVAQLVKLSVQVWLRSTSVSIQKRMHLEITGGASRRGIEDAAHASALVKQAHDACLELRKTVHGTIHLFTATPIAFNILFGTQLNSLGPIQMYEFNNQTREYNPSYLIQ